MPYTPCAQECLKCENDRIKHELEKATSIIGVLKQAHNQKTYHPERWATSTAALSMQSRYETGWGKPNPVVRVKRLNNTKMNSTHCLLTRSAFPDTNMDSLDRAVNRMSEVRVSNHCLFILLFCILHWSDARQLSFDGLKSTHFQVSRISAINKLAMKAPST